MISRPYSTDQRYSSPNTTTQTCLKPKTWSVDKGQSGIGTEYDRGPVWLEVRLPWSRRSRPRTHGPLRARSIPINTVVPGQMKSVEPVHRAVRVIVVRKIWPRILDLHRGDVSTQRDASGTTEKVVSKRSNEVQGHGDLDILAAYTITSRKLTYQFIRFINGSKPSNTCPDQLFLCPTTLLMRSRNLRRCTATAFLMLQYSDPSVRFNTMTKQPRLFSCSILPLFSMRTFPSYPSDPDETPRRRWSSKQATIGRNVSHCGERAMSVPYMAISPHQ